MIDRRFAGREIEEREVEKRLYRPRKARVCDTHVSDRIRFIVRETPVWKV